MPRQTTASHRLDDAIIGAWDLVRAVYLDGEVPIFPYGARPFGQLVCSSDGAYAWQLARSDVSAPASVRVPRDLVPGRPGMWGRYVAHDDGRLVFRVDGCAAPELIGSVQERRYAFVDGQLEIRNAVRRVEGLRTLSYQLLWSRRPRSN